MNVVILGASNKPERYSYKAFQLLKEQGYQIFPVHLRLTEIEGTPVFFSINDIAAPIHTITLYVGKENSDKILSDIISKRPQRIIFNPGAENDDLERAAQAEGIETVHACTLVLLRTGQF